MTAQRQDSQSAPNPTGPNSAEAARNAGRSEPALNETAALRDMWNAVAALLDDTTVGARSGAAPASPSAAAVAPPAAPQAAAPVIPAPAPAPEPAAPVAQPPAQPASSQGGSSFVPPPLTLSKNGTLTVAPRETPREVPREVPFTELVPHETPRDSGNIGPQVLPAMDAALPVPGTEFFPVAGPPPGEYSTPAAGSAPAKKAPTPPREPGSPFVMPPGLDYNAATIRGRNDGVSIELGNGEWSDLLYVLAYRLEQAAGFFKGGHIAVEVGARQILEPDLHALRTLMISHDMDPSILRTSSERTFQSALALGMPVAQTTPDGTPITEALPALVEDSILGYFIYRGSLRSGQVLYRHEHVLVLGDVNPGAEVVSDGDIMVWGRLRGIAHAGAKGNVDALISALDLDPVQLRIDRVIAAAQAGAQENAPRWGGARAHSRRPEIARLVNGRLTIEAWDEAKTAGAPLLKRRRN